ncbi:Protein of unknown function [Bacillus mycoides]|nr:Protein of unknown function [Bacillus mycoides]SCM96340.1 Protein of unknown function [Bacillus mycoides]
MTGIRNESGGDAYI